jgi:hypothetical protein
LEGIAANKGQERKNNENDKISIINHFKNPFREICCFISPQTSAATNPEAFPHRRIPLTRARALRMKSK